MASGYSEQPLQDLGIALMGSGAANTHPLDQNCEIQIFRCDRGKRMAMGRKWASTTFWCPDLEKLPCGKTRRWPYAGLVWWRVQDSRRGL
jgi:hypothetical protein